MAPEIVRSTEIQRRRGGCISGRGVIKARAHNLTHGFEFTPEIGSHNTFVTGQAWGDANLLHLTPAPKLKHPRQEPLPIRSVPEEEQVPATYLPEKLT